MSKKRKSRSATKLALAESQAPEPEAGAASPAEPNEPSPPVEAGDSGWRAWAPWAIFGLFLLVVVMGLRPPKAKGEYDIVAFGKLPVQLGGRVKPMDSVARNAILRIAGQQKVPLEGNGPGGEWGDLIKLHDKHGGKGLYYRKFYQRFNKHPKKLEPVEWLMEVLMRPEVADRRFIFRIDLPELLNELKLETTGVDQSGLRFYSFEQVRPYVLRLHKQSQQISAIKEELRTPYQRAVYKLAGAVHLYIQLRYSLQPNELVLDRTPSASQRARRSWENELAMQRVAATYSRAATADFAAEVARLGRPNPLRDVLMKEHEQALQSVQEFLRGQMFATNEVARLSKVGLDNLQLGLLRGLPDEVEERLALLNQALLELPGNTPESGHRRQQLIETRVMWTRILQAHESIREIVDQAPEQQQLGLARALIVDRLVYQAMAGRGHLLIVPPNQPKGDNSGWKKSGVVLAEMVELGNPSPVQLQHLATIATAFAGQQPKAFNEGVAKYTQWLKENQFHTELRKGREEHYFNSFAPFARSMGVYISALLLAGFSWLNLSRWLSRSAFYLIGLALVVHTVGLIFRMYLEGRPPVTNLYSSAVFCGWGAVLLGWVLERIYRNGIGSFTAGAVGFATLIIARHLAREGDTMEMLQAVLDTNFWLATHVTCITIGYSATFLAGFLALVYVLRGTFTKSLEAATAKTLARMVYGIVCFATLFSFVGTVLGGIWADYSWGRFWGWDSKENGALLIVLWNVLVLHAKWGGLVRERGMVNLVILGNVITAWSWFGVNMLGIGLHSYGFMDEAWNTLKWFAISQFVIMMVGCLPLHYWASGRHLVGKSGKAA